MDTSSFDPRMALAGIQMTVFAVFLVVYFGQASPLSPLSFFIAVVGTSLTVFGLRE
ncbi:hypothetical protein SAMN05216388_1005131 [Halorientalis persicus]|jgi:archaellum biogenesis protein FlaJ (TadC family)|uniref:Uncharacterized protein n=1 Tax=Halorientalis persicus TaxID=1367881 RepID=A0A1H8JNB9_9EURY|nr:hypothetical protein [Halorientalis persicus]SEN82210.1 hypothetical protein SAMN05216388_1005131 [Halorientalis persicus]